MEILSVFTRQNYDLFSVGVAATSILIIGLAVFLSNKQSATNVSFLFFSIFAVLWSSFNYLVYQSSDPAIVIVILRSSIFFAVWHSFFLFRLFYAFPKDRVVFPKFYTYLVVPLVLVTSGFTLTPLVFKEVSSFSTSGRVEGVVNGPGIFLFVSTILFLVCAGLYILFRKMWKASKEDKTKFRLVFLGVLFSFFLIILFNMVLPALFGNAQFTPLGALFLLPFVAFTYYAIARHGLLRVKLVATEVVTFFLAIISLFEVIFSQDVFTVLFRFIMFLFVLIFGVLLIRGVRREIEQREKMELLSRELEIANAELKKLDQAKSEFISIASHQLRAPLTVVRGYISLIREGTVKLGGEEGDQAFSRIDVSLNQLIKLINDLLDLSRIEAGKIQYNFKPLDLLSIIEPVIKNFKLNADKKNLTIVFQKPLSPPPLVFSDYDKIREVINNLVDNAIKYSVPGGEVEVNVENKAEKKLLKIVVKDQGIGIEKDDLKKLFTKFSRTEEARKADPSGMGIGLYFVKRVIEDHGGEVWIESEGLGKGTTVTIELPAMVESQIQTEPSPE